MSRPADPRVAVIVGGSGRLGGRIAGALATAGWTVVAASRRGTYDANAGRRIGAGVDVRQPDELAGLARLARRRGPLRGWVNAAATTGPVGRLGPVDVAAWQETVAVNLLGCVAGCAAAVRYATPGSAVLNISGGGAAGPRPGVAAYAASKAAVVRHTETLAAELGAARLRVNALAPGAFASDLWSGALQEVEGPAPTATASEAVLRRAAACAAWLLSDESRPLTGKLVAAQWDPWDTWAPDCLAALQDSDRLTLRRQPAEPVR
jgi:NAD(P)-dependent dehydrogenase (short-subunit alcohol dehydrogenase family)